MQSSALLKLDATTQKTTELFDQQTSRLIVCLTVVVKLYNGGVTVERQHVCTVTLSVNSRHIRHLHAIEPKNLQ